MKFLIFVAITATLLFADTFAEDKSAEDSGSPVVSLSQGKLRGKTYETRKGNKYYGFLGVPYGKAPVRFGAPQEPDSWEGEKAATKLAPSCFQFCLLQQRLIGVEDCLTLNVYTPKLDGKAPVMVMYHGGGFMFGSGSLHEAKYFMEEEVVLITVQYRLGALGFLNLGDGTVPGNNGLRDQTVSLQWVQKNIHKFGGDPKRVTIFGFSAGGASVHYQMLSPMAKGLFAGAISQSGSVLNPWALQTQPRKYALLLAENVGCTRETSREIVECLHTKTPSEIVNGQLQLSKFPHEFDLISMLIGPSVEEGDYEPKFLSESPYKLLERGEVTNKVPWIIGVNRDEGGLYIASIVENDKSIEVLNSDWYKMLPNILYFENTASPKVHRKISEKVKDFYFGGGKMTRDNHLQLNRVFGDRFFVTGVSKAIRMQAKKSDFPVYPYIFSYKGDHSITQGFVRAQKDYGVSHADDLQFLFNKTYGAPEHTLDTEDGKFSEKFVKLYVSFARDGKPTTWGPSWEPLKLDADDETVTWYNIDKDNTVLTEDPFKERTDFWESLPIKELGKETDDDAEEKDEL